MEAKTSKYFSTEREPMKVGLFIPCYIDQFYPQVGMATVQLLENLNIDFEVPSTQTCCGQPMFNTGCTRETIGLIDKYVKEYQEYDAIICPSGSCTAMIRHHYLDIKKEAKDFEQVRKVAEKTYELCEFLHDVAKIKELNISFPHKVGIHQGCHGLRELKLGSPSEIMSKQVDKIANMLLLVKDVEIMPLSRTDECCGFGGLFSVMEPEISCRMGNDRINDHLNSHVEVMTSADMSCLMHMDGLIRRRKLPLRVKHIAEILAGMAE